MATYTENLELFKYDPEVDKKKTFNISQGLNQNWDKLDATVGELQSANNADTDLSNLTVTGQAKFDEKVSKSGDTINGEVVVRTGSNFPVQLQAMHINKNVTPDAAKYCGYDIRDVNNNRLVWLGLVDHPTNGKFIELQTQGGTSGFQFPRCTTVPTATSTASSRRVVVGTGNYRSGTAFVRQYSDGWCVQGGTLPAGSNVWTTGTLLRGYNNTNYHIFINGRSASGATNNATFQYECAAPASATTFSYYAIGYQQAWLAFGYIT